MAAVSKAQICNLALAHIKQTKTTISNLTTDTGSVATQCRIHHDVSRKFVLEDHNWNFATKRVVLSDIGSPPATWNYRYDYPSDCIKFQSIQRLAKTDVPVPFLVEDDGTDSGLCILTDMASAVGIYTRDVENTNLFSAGFVTAFSWLLASELAPALAGNDKAQQAALTVYKNYMVAAQSNDSSEGEADEELAASWERARLS